MNDEEAHAFYSNPEHLEIAGPGQRRERAMKTVMTPIRFAPEMIAAVKRFASEDGMTVSTWIRAIIAREIQRRQPPATSAAPAPELQFHYAHDRSPQSQTVGSSSVVPELCVA